jgi:hypothetical protein
MIYCTYSDYQAAGGNLEAATFDIYAARASRLIDGITFGRAETHVDECDRCRAALSDACVQIIQLLAAAQNAVTTNGYAPGVSSVSNDGYTVNYSSADSMTATTQAEAAQIVRGCLGDDPHGLLYRGVC